MISTGENGNVLEQQLPNESPARLHQVGVFRSAAEAEAFCKAFDSFEREWPGLVDVSLHRDGHVVSHYGPSTLARQQAMAIVNLWLRAAIYAKTEAIAQIRRHL